MKALSIRPPWAGLIIHGKKDIENRDWPTRIRGRVAIHASAKPGPTDRQEALELYEKIRGRMLSEIDEYKWWHDKVCAAGAILGTVEIVDCVTSSSSPWFFGEYGFVLHDPRPLVEPIPCLGKLGFWDLPLDVERRINCGGRG